MKVVFEVKRNKENGKSSLNIKKGDVLLYNGSEWYVTTQEELFMEYNKKINNAITEYDRKFKALEKEYEQFLTEYTEQNTKLINLIEGLVKE